MSGFLRSGRSSVTVATPLVDVQREVPSVIVAASSVGRGSRSPRMREPGVVRAGVELLAVGVVEPREQLDDPARRARRAMCVERAAAGGGQLAR